MALTRDRVHTPEQALAYLADCTLATVEMMAMKKSRQKGEFGRQISIAQRAVSWMVEMGVSAEGTRAQEVIDQGGSVDEWVKQFVV